MDGSPDPHGDHRLRPLGAHLPRAVHRRKPPILDSRPSRRATRPGVHKPLGIIPGPRSSDRPRNCSRRASTSSCSASPAHVHLEQGLSALASGAALVIDKPFAASVAEAEQLIAAAASSALPLIVFQNRRWDGDFLTVRKLLGEGALGEVHRFESTFERWSPELRTTLAGHDHDQPGRRDRLRSRQSPRRPGAAAVRTGDADRGRAVDPAPRRSERRRGVPLAAARQRHALPPHDEPVRDAERAALPRARLDRGVHGLRPRRTGIGARGGRLAGRREFRARAGGRCGARSASRAPTTACSRAHGERRLRPLLRGRRRDDTGRRAVARGSDDALAALRIIARRARDGGNLTPISTWRARKSAARYCSPTVRAGAPRHSSRRASSSRSTTRSEHIADAKWDFRSAIKRTLSGGAGPDANRANGMPADAPPLDVRSGFELVDQLHGLRPSAPPRTRRGPPEEAGRDERVSGRRAPSSSVLGRAASLMPMFPTRPPGKPAATQIPHMKGTVRRQKLTAPCGCHRTELEKRPDLGPRSHTSAHLRGV